MMFAPARLGNVDPLVSDEGSGQARSTSGASGETQVHSVLRALAEPPVPLVCLSFPAEEGAVAALDPAVVEDALCVLFARRDLESPAT